MPRTCIRHATASVDFSWRSYFVGMGPYSVSCRQRETRARGMFEVALDL